MIQQKHARILREALAKLHPHLPPHYQEITLKALDDYAEQLRPYCEHPEESYVPAQQKVVCLDCCRRRERDEGPKI